MGGNLVLVGGGHGHLTTLKKVAHFTRRGHKVTLVSPGTYHYYSGMGPGMLGGSYEPEAIRFAVKEMAVWGGAEFIQGSVNRIDPEKKAVFLNSGEEILYDVVSFNIGSIVPAGFVKPPCDNVFTVKPIENLLKAREAILRFIQNGKPRIVVVGGGPAGTEISGNLWKLLHENNGSGSVTLVAGDKLLQGFHPTVRAIAKTSLTSRDIEVLEEESVARIKNGEAVLSSGKCLPFDFAFVAVGVKPPALFRESAIGIGEDDGLLVNGFLQSITAPEIFGTGDCITFNERPLNRVGVYAVRQNPIVYHNLLAALEHRSLKSFDAHGSYLLIFNLGDGTGIFCRNRWIWNGRLAFVLKNYIDKKFMRKFRARAPVGQ